MNLASLTSKEFSFKRASVNIRDNDAEFFVKMKYTVADREFIIKRSIDAVSKADEEIIKNKNESKTKETKDEKETREQLVKTLENGKHALYAFDSLVFEIHRAIRVLDDNGELVVLDDNVIRENFDFDELCIIRDKISEIRGDDLYTDVKDVDEYEKDLKKK